MSLLSSLLSVMVVSPARKPSSAAAALKLRQRSCGSGAQQQQQQRKQQPQQQQHPQSVKTNKNSPAQRANGVSDPLAWVLGCFFIKIIARARPLCYAVLCFAWLCYAMLCYAMRCYAMLCYAMHCYDRHCTGRLRSTAVGKVHMSSWRRSTVSVMRSSIPHPHTSYPIVVQELVPRVRSAIARITEFHAFKTWRRCCCCSCHRMR